MRVVSAVINWMQNDLPGTTLERHRPGGWLRTLFVLRGAGGDPRLYSLFGPDGIAYWLDRDDYLLWRPSANLCPGGEVYELIRAGRWSERSGFADWDDPESFEYWVALCEGRTTEMPEMTPPAFEWLPL